MTRSIDSQPRPLDEDSLPVDISTGSGSGVALKARIAASRILAPVAAAAVLAFMAFALWKLSTEVTYSALVAALASVPLSALILACLATAASYLSLTFYDVSALFYAGRRLRFREIALVAFCAYAVGNTAGFGPLSGGAIRYRLYSRFGLDPRTIAQVVGFVTIAFGFGLAIVAAFATIVSAERLSASTGISTIVLRYGSASMLFAASVAVFGLARHGMLRLGRWAVPLPRPRVVIQQLVVTAADIVFASAALYVLLPASDMGFPAFLAVYAVAVGLGVLSHVPGGLGVIEAVVVGALAGQLSIPSILSALVMYRIVYHVLPLLLATVLLVLVESRHLLAKTALGSGVARIAPLVISALTALAGLVLVYSSVTPTPASDLEAVSSFLPESLIEIAHFVSGILGLCLLVLARGLSQRLDGAWWMATAMTAVALGFCFVKAIAVYEATLLLVLVGCLCATRHLFVRPASLFRQALTGPWLLSMAVVILSAGWLLLFAYQDIDYGNELWLQFQLSSEAPRSIRALTGMTVLALAAGLWSLTRPAPGPVVLPKPDEIDKAIAIVDGQDVADANLLRCGDKALLFSEKGDAFLMYSRRGRTWVCLFEPLGAATARTDLVWSFIEMAREANGRAVFYQMSPEGLAACADTGLITIKLGEVATVDLRRFDLKGAERAGLRATFNRGLREGLEFEFVQASQVGSILEDLRRISDAWLDQRKVREKRFSVGFFCDAYIRSQPVALLRHKGRIVAFANVLTTSTKAEGSIDLMRFTPDAPRSCMEYLFVCLMLHLAADGYASFNLGMAPLSGLGGRAAAPIWQHLGRALFEKGGRFYNFKGLRGFKSKFAPEWHPRYLTVQGGLNPAIALADVSALISDGLAGVVRR